MREIVKHFRNYGKCRMIPDVFGKLKRIRKTSRKQCESQEHVRRYMNFAKNGGILEGQWEMQE